MQKNLLNELIVQLQYSKVLSAAELEMQIKQNAVFKLSPEELGNIIDADKIEKTNKDILKKLYTEIDFQALISSYFKDKVYVLDSTFFDEKILANISDQADKKLLEDCYIPGQNVYNLRTGLSNEDEKRLLELKIKYGLDPAVISVKTGLYVAFLVLNLPAGIYDNDEEKGKAVCALCGVLTRWLQNKGKQQQPTVQAIGISPNTLIHGEPNSLIDGGPAHPLAILEPKDHEAEKKYAQFSSPVTGLQTALKKVSNPGFEPERDVDVCILDSLPEIQPDHFINTHGNSNLLINALAKNSGVLKMHEYNWDRQDFDNYKHTDESTDQASAEQSNAENAEPSSHGLFIAGIIHLLTQKAKLHLIEVLNKELCGDLKSLVWGMTRLGALLSSYPERYFVINCSFVMKKQIGDADSPYYIFLNKLFGFMLEKIENRGFILCAAGNSYKENMEQEGENSTMIPALFKGTLGIGAFTLDNDKIVPADYSNKADIHKNEGYWALGGQPEYNKIGNSAGSSQNVNPRSGNAVALLSACTSKHKYARDIRSNETGWARGTGTSFATAVASGAFALLLLTADSNNTGPITSQVKKMIDGYSEEAKILGAYPDVRIDPDHNVIELFQIRKMPASGKSFGNLLKSALAALVSLFFRSL